jgi:hypothetical protein
MWCGRSSRCHARLRARLYNCKYKWETSVAVVVLGKCGVHEWDMQHNHVQVPTSAASIS